MRVYAYTQGIIKPPLEARWPQGHRSAGRHCATTSCSSTSGARRSGSDGFTFHQANDEYRAPSKRARGRSGPRAAASNFSRARRAIAPVAYAPHIAAGVVAQTFGLDFATTLYLMRFAGLAAFTAIAAYAVAMTPHLKWAFLLIAMLPAALYGRSVIGADGAVNSLSLLVAALSLRAASGLLPDRPLERALWMTLCVLSKPPQIVFILLRTDDPSLPGPDAALAHRRARGSCPASSCCRCGSGSSTPRWRPGG